MALARRSCLGRPRVGIGGGPRAARTLFLRRPPRVPGKVQAQRDRGGRRVRFAYQVERQPDAKIRCLPACGRLADRVQMLRDLIVRANPPDMWFAPQGL